MGRCLRSTFGITVRKAKLLRKLLQSHSSLVLLWLRVTDVNIELVDLGILKYIGIECWSLINACGFFLSRSHISCPSRLLLSPSSLPFISLNSVSWIHSKSWTYELGCEVPWFPNQRYPGKVVQTTRGHHTHLCEIRLANNRSNNSSDNISKLMW